MYEIKKQIFLNLSKSQKTAICNCLRAFVKKMKNYSPQDILDKFVADEKYYLELNCSRFYFLSEILETESFCADALKYINQCLKFYDFKEKQRPIIEANKNFEKQKRKFLQEVKMSKEPPTKKQIYYYKKLCKKYNLAEIDLQTKLDAKNIIDKIITEHETQHHTFLEEN